MLVSKHPEYLPYLDNPGGTFNWRFIAGTTRLSPHSFGMTIDINSELSNYWQWDLKKEGRPIDENEPLVYKNNIPWEIVAVFEKNGFIWGGRWYHYDSMHFEYRPELLIN
ncbi:MAG: M15 family metallopeptidase [Legionella sp.]|nr:M15 family metallopeptidase [Legionella sp.]